MASSEQPDASETAATLNAAMQAHQQGNLAAASRLYAETLQLDPDHIQALRLKGILSRETGDLATSLALLEHAHSAAPDASAPLNELALTQMVAGQFDAAEASWRQVLNLNPIDGTALTNLGALMQHRGHVRTAIECYEALLEQQPDDVDVRCNLAKALVDAGSTDAALAACDLAIAASKSHPFALATKGAILTDLEQYPEARDLLKVASEQLPDDMTLLNLALCQDALKDPAAAADSLRQAIEINAFNARAVADLSNCLVKLDQAHDAIRLCEKFLAQHPGECLVIGSLALALDAAGQHEQVARITDCEGLVKTFRIDPPATLGSAQDFNALLAETICNDESLLSDPVSKSTLGGSQTGELDFEATAELRELRHFFDRSVRQSVADFLTDGLSEHPILARQSERWSLRGWGTVIRSGGKQTSHMHPLGWLSGVYYVQVPAGMGDGDDNAGALSFGIAPERFEQSHPADTCYQPQAGLLVLFPSWLWHQTIPFAANETRISIAFDVMPDNALRML